MSVKLEHLRKAGIPFVVAGLPDGQVAWFVPNLAVSDDPEDWPFHAHKQGVADTLDAAAEAIRTNSGRRRRLKAAV